MQQMVFYYKTYFSLNMFRAPLCPSSGAQELYRWYVSGWRDVLHPANRTHNPHLHTISTALNMYNIFNLQ